MANQPSRQGVVAVLADLIFETKICSTANALGAPAIVVRSSEVLDAGISTTSASLVLVDLNPAGDSAIDLVKTARAHPSELYVVAFASHVNADLLAEAGRAGAHSVMPRSQFAAQLPDLITTHCKKLDTTGRPPSATGDSSC